MAGHVFPEKIKIDSEISQNLTKTSYSHGHNVRNISAYEYSVRNVRAAILWMERRKYKGSTALNIANEILAQLRK